MANIQKVALVDRGKVISSGSGEGGGGDATIRYNEETDWIQVMLNDTWTNCYYAGMKLDPSKMTLTQDEFIAICNQGLQSMMTLGAIVTLNNETCNQFEVIDKNHDGTSNTVDLMAHTQVNNMAFGESQDYNTSSVRTWLLGTYYDKFDLSIRNLMKPMTVITSGVSNTDKIKLLSWRELGLTAYTWYDTNDGGNQYPVFTAGSQGTAILNRWRQRGTYGNDSQYYMRSKVASSPAYVNIVKSDGTCTFQGYSSSYTAGVLPVMRF